MRGFSLLCLAVSAFAQGIWERRAPYPISATEVSAAALNGRIYALCGLTPQGSTNQMFAYDPVRDAWSPAASLPFGADHCNVAAAGGKLYFLGAPGRGETWEYDPAADRWQQVGQMGVPRGASGVAAIGARIFVAGGLGPNGSTAAAEVFDTTTRAWTRLPDLPTARDHLTAQAVNGKFYAISGRTGEVLSANEEYDPATNAWRRRAPIPTPRGGLGSGVIGGRIQVFGGEGPSGTPEGTYRQNEEYDPATDAWRALAPMQTPRHGIYGAALDGRIFVPGGGPRAGAFYSDVHEVFYLPPADPPQFTTDGVANAASGDRAIAPGMLVSIFGRGLSHGEQAATRFPLPTEMNGVFVNINGRRVPLLFVGPGQINVQAPFDLPIAAARIQISNAGAESALVAIGSVVESAPGIFTLGGSTQAAALISGTGQVAGPGGRPARRGEVLEIYATGLGRLVDPPPPPGEPAPAALNRSAEIAVVTIGGIQAEVLYSGLAPGFAGLYQVNARVPANAPAGSAVPIMLRMGAAGRASNQVTVGVE